MDTESRHLLLAEAKNIAQNLLSRSKRDEHGMYWETRGTNNNKKVEWVNTDHLYSGDAGIILFLTELSRLDNDLVLKATAYEACKALYQRVISTPSENYAFYTGRSGIAYLLSLTADYFGDPAQYIQAVALLKSSQTFLGRETDDFLNGIAGTLFVLVFVHAYTQEKALEPLIQMYLDKLVSKTNLGGKGLYWDRSGQFIKGLCGISHGASGIGHVFRELSRYFGSEALKEFSSLAFAYESQFFDTNRINWPDFRKGVYDEESYEEHKQAYLQGNKELFTEASYMAAWCHGAPGIGLTRVFETDQVNQDLEQAAQSTRTIFDNTSPTGSFTLCHGFGGNALLFTELSKLANQSDSWTESLTKLALKALNQKRERGYYVPGYSYRMDVEDTSLFLGNAGIGYFLIQLLSENPLSNILIPRIPSKPISSNFAPAVATVSDHLISIYFPKTKKYIDLNYPEIDLAVSINDIGSIADHLDKKINKNPEARKDKVLQDVLKLEARIFTVDQQIESLSYLDINRQVASDQIKEAIQTHKSDFKFQLAPFVEMHHCAHDWSAFDESPSIESIESDKCQMLIIPSPETTRAIKLTDFSIYLIEILAHPITFDDLMEACLELFDHENEDEKVQVTSFIHTEILEAAGLGIISVKEGRTTDLNILESKSTLTTAV